MSDVTYKLNGSTTSEPGNDIASVDIQDDGFIEAAYLDVSVAGADALTDEAIIEVSFASTNTFSVNDVRSSILMARIVQNFLTSGGGVQGKSVSIALGKGIPVNAGERIHMHGTVSSGGTVRGICYLYVVTSRGVTRRATRRRR